MKKVLYILGSFDDADADWLVQSGRPVDVPDGRAIIREGEPIDSLFFVTSGTFRVTAGSRELARVGTGEVVGEISFVDARPPTATVTAVENGRVLAIPRAALLEKLETDAVFASRFYRAIATFLAYRLRSTLGTRGEEAEPMGWDELNLDELHSFSQAGARFERILHRLQQV
jgi:CRP-like cAMP-binding protein